MTQEDDKINLFSRNTSPESQRDPADGSLILENEKRRIRKNIWLISLAFLFNFMSFSAVSSLQSSLNYKKGLGTTSLSVIYGVLILSAMFTPTYLISKFGCKWTIGLSIIGYVIYPFSNFYPSWETLIPSSIILGIVAAPLWSAKCTYITSNAIRYAHISKEREDVVISRFFATFFLFFQLSNVIGQLLATLILSSDDLKSNLVLPKCFNFSFIDNYCGTSDCQEDFEAVRKYYDTLTCPITNFHEVGVNEYVIHTFMLVFAGMGYLGFTIVAVFVDPLTDEKKETGGVFDLFFETFNHFKNNHLQQKLLLITIYTGAQQAFLIGDFTRSYVSCTLGLNWIGFVLLCYGAADSLSSIGFGIFNKYVDRVSLLTIAFFINLIIKIAFLRWNPHRHSPLYIFLIAGAWGFTNAAWQSQLNACYGEFFMNDQEAAYSNYRLWESIGFVIVFATQHYLCVTTRLWCLIILLVLGMLLYLVSESLYERQSTSKKLANIRNSRIEQEDMKFRPYQQILIET